MPEGLGLSRPGASFAKGQRGLGRGWAIFACLCVILIALRAGTLLFDHSLHSIDGAMQTWFAADNFADGAPLGEAFQSYLGITMILALLPGFMAFGGTLWASTLAAYAMVMAGCFAGAYAIAWMVRPISAKNRWIWAMLLIFLFYYAARIAAEIIGLAYPATFDPGVSLRPLRGALPFFVLPVFVWALRALLETRRARPAFAFGLASGFALLWSNDAGIPLVIASVIALVAALFRQTRLLIKAIFIFAIGTAVSASLIVMIVTHGDPSGWFQYNFTDVPSDQFWYFAPWAREARVLSIFDLPRIFMQGQLLSTLSLIVLILCIITAMVRRFIGRGSLVRMSAFIFVGASIAGTALIPQVGGHIGSEYNAITFVFGMCAPLIVFQDAWFARAKPLFRQAPRLGVSLTAALAGLTMVGVDAGQLVYTAQNTDRSVYSDKLGFYVTPAMANDLAAMERFSRTLGEVGYARDERILSVYTSALDIAAGTKSPAPVGSLIHALGERNRIAYNELLFGKTVAVTTIAPDYTGWAGWNSRANWPFFRNLRDLYRPIGRNDQHVLWIRSAGNPRPQEATCETSNWNYDSFEVTIESDRSGLASVFIEREGFEAGSRSALLTVTEDSPFTRSVREPQWTDFPRYGIANSRIVEVSAPVRAGEQTRLNFEVLDGSAIGWGKCYVRVYEPVDYAALPSIPEGVDALIAQGRKAQDQNSKGQNSQALQ